MIARHNKKPKGGLRPGGESPKNRSASGSVFGGIPPRASPFTRARRRAARRAGSRSAGPIGKPPASETVEITGDAYRPSRLRIALGCLQPRATENQPSARDYGPLRGERRLIFRRALKLAWGPIASP